MAVGVAVTPGPQPVAATEAVAAVAAAPAQVAATYANPLGVPAPARDPFILRSGSTYYAYVSGFDYILAQYGARVFQSTDLVTWTSAGNALPVATAGAWADRSSGFRFSAPSVREIGTNPASQRFVMYFTGVHATSGDSCIGVATSAAATGPFIGAANPLICPPGGARDPSAVPVPDGSGIQEVLYRRSSDAGIYNQVLSADGLSLAAGWSPLLLYRAQPNWWHEGVADRPAIVVDPDGDPYLVFSGGTPNTGGRAMSWSPCSHIGVIFSCQNQTSLGTWVAGTSQVDAPSGGQPFLDAQGHQWLVYQGFGAGACPGPTTTCAGNPTMRIDKVCFAHGHLRTNAPSTGTQSGTRNGDCSVDVPRPALSVASASDGGTFLGVPGSPINLDGVASTAAGGKVLWSFGDTFTCPGAGPLNNSGGFGPPAAAAEGPNWAQRNCAEIVPRTASEAAFEAANASCTPPPGGSCQIKRFTMWSAVLAGMPDGGAVVPFSKVVWANTLTPDNGDPGTEPQASGWVPTPLGVGLARVTAANVAAGVPVADRSPAVSPLSCNPGAAAPDTATGCLFNESVSPTSNSDRFWRAVVDGDHLYLFSDFSWNDQLQVTGNTKVARAPLGSVGTASAWQYWAGPGPDAWTASYAQAADVPGMQAGSTSYNAYLGRYVNTWADFGGAISIQTADRLTGPWSPLQSLHDQVECPGGVSYDGRLHPELHMDGGRTLALAYFSSAATGCAGGSRWATVRLG